MTRSLRSLPWGEQVCQVLAAALRAVEPGEAVRKHLLREGDTLFTSGRRYSLSDYRRVYLTGFGKAAVPMGIAAARLLEGWLSQGLLLTKEGYEGDGALMPSRDMEILIASHPIPDERGRLATQKITQVLSSAGQKDLVICLVSGGSSALLTDPVEGVSLKDIQLLTDPLLRSGASIGEINTLRKHLDRVKGGGLRRIAPLPTVISLILSDVVGDPLDLIASGPWLPDPSTYQDALDILERYGLLQATPAAILSHLSRGAKGEIPETPKPGDPIFDNTHNIIVGSGTQAANAAVECAQTLGWNGLLLTTALEGEACTVGKMLAGAACQVNDRGLPVPRPACLVAAGETTVTVKGGGTGGRNQELALGAIRDMAGIPQAALASLATDGGDGPTPAAGAVATGESLSRACRLGMEPEDFLNRNDAFHFFEPLEDLLITGPTQTNVNDLVLLFLGDIYDSTD